MSNRRVYEFRGELLHETAMAYLVYEGEQEVWIPISQVLNMELIKDDDYIFKIPEWLAIEKEIV